MVQTSEHTTTQRHHFHTFDALRFFACFKVFLHHLPVVAFPWFNIVKKGGGIGVQFFFVLSGILITYIICEEKQRTGGLNLKHFFMRRVLRIWPLFYLAIFIAFITPYLLGIIHLNSSAAGYEPDWLVSALFLENYKMIWTGDVPNASPLGVMWSLCIEEHFYIVWGLLLYFLPFKHLHRLIAVCLAIAIAARIFFVQYGLSTSDLLTNIDLFAYGAIPAYLLIAHKERLHSWVGGIPLYAKRLFTLVLIAVVVLFSQLNGDAPFVWASSILGLLFAMLIILTLPPDTKFRIKDGSIISKLGIYTYGFYIYHTLVINLLNRVFEKMQYSLDVWYWAIVFVSVSFLLSILCSYLSYHLYEKQFLKLKRYFR
ncbi:hypothetical protein CAP35_08510 [Chitinophagaceae bacterium IBVUCB1]|nr:hypothetical protein CAP35_08510 [Chitinophagaceae bacterium IBVUCB1]